MSDYIDSVLAEIVVMRKDDKNNYTIEDSRHPIPAVLRIQGNILITSNGYTNLATIRVYNLKEEYRTYLSDSKCKIEMKGGKLGKESLFLVADVFNSSEDLENGVDLVTTIYCGEGYLDMRESMTQKAFAGEQDFSEVIKSVALTFKSIKQVDFSKAPLFMEKKLKIKNYVASGRTAIVLDSLCKKAVNQNGDQTIEWTYSGDTVIVYDKGTIYDKEANVVIKDSANIIGTPTINHSLLTVMTQFSPQINLFQTLEIDYPYVLPTFDSLGTKQQASEIRRELDKRILGKKSICSLEHTFDNKGTYQTRIQAWSAIERISDTSIGGNV